MRGESLLVALLITLTSALGGEECGGRLVDFGVITLGDQVKNGNAGPITCTWYLEASADNSSKSDHADGTYGITAVSDRIGMDPTSEWFAVYQNDVLLFNYTGGNFPEVVYVGAKGKLVYHSLSTPTAGFYLQASTSRCSVEVQGIIKSPNFPFAYPNNFVCIYHLNKKSKMKFIFDFENFNLAPDHDILGHYEGGVLTRTYSQIYFRPRFDTMVGTGYLNFTTDSKGSGTGFMIKVTLRECGTKMETAGELTSPNYPIPFSGYIFCKWDLVAEPGKILQLRMAEVSLQESNQFLRILTSSKSFRNDYRGKVDSHNLLLDSPATVIFSSKTENRGGALWLNFSSTECGGVVTEAVHIVSFGYPHDYPDNAKCIWTLVEVPGKYVRLHMEYADLSRDGFDRVELYQGSSWFKTYYGETANDTVDLGTHGRVEFYTNVGDRARGFSMRVAYVDSELTLAGSGRVTSPGYPNDYPNDVTYYWHLEAEPGQMLLLEFQELQIADGDHLSVYMDGGLLKDYTGLDFMPYRDVLDSAVTLRLDTDSARRAKGFLIDFSSIECGKALNGSGVVASPGFPSRFTGSAVCTWDLTADPGKSVYLEFVQMNLHPSIQSLGISSSPFEEKFDSGIGAVEDYVIALNRTASVTWTSHMSSLGGSFKLSFTSIDECGGELNGSGYIEAPSYDSLYPDNSHCTWNLRASPGQVLILEVDTNLYPDNFDRVEVYEGTTLIKTYYAFSYTDRVSLGAEGSVVFRSNLGGRGLGFFISFTSEECGGTLIGSGIIVPGPAPFEYAANLFCNWSIIAEGKAIQLEFIMLDLEGSNDTVEIYENGTLLSSYYDIFHERHVVVARNSANVVFRSDSQIAGPGFYMLVSSFVCGGHLIGPGFIGFTAPPYRYAHAKNVTCKWTLEAIPPQRQVELTVLSVTQFEPFARFIPFEGDAWYRRRDEYEMFVAYEGDRLAFSSKNIQIGYNTKLNSTVTISFTKDLGVRNASFIISVK